MKICPIALAVGCVKCPVFKVCPLTSVIGDQPAKGDKPVAKSVAATRKARPVAAAKTSRGAKSVAARKKPR
jgi:hypothetical protein